MGRRTAPPAAGVNVETPKAGLKMLDASPNLLDTLADVPFAKIFISLPIYFVSFSFRTSTSVSARGKMAISSMWPTNPRASMRS